MKLLVTGGAGFIGSNYVRRSLDGTLPGNDSIVVLDKLTYAGDLENLELAKNSPNFEFVQGDICDLELVTELVSDVDAIINFAAESHVDRSITGAADFVRTNVDGVRTLLDAILIANRKARFVQISTDEVYGSIESGSWNEQSPILPNSPYSASKASAELLVRAYAQTHGLDVVTTRCSNNYGPHHYPEKLIPLIITNLMKGKKIPIYGNGLNVRDWLHVDDHCRGIHLVLRDGRSTEIYNIGGGEELNNVSIAKIIIESMGFDDSVIEFVGDRKGHDFRYSVDWQKIYSELGYSPSVNFNKGISETIAWYQSNVSWWEKILS